MEPQESTGDYTYIYIYMYIYIYVLEPCWGSLGFKLEVLEVQIEGLGGLLESMLDLVEHK